MAQVVDHSAGPGKGRPRDTPSRALQSLSVAVTASRVYVTGKALCVKGRHVPPRLRKFIGMLALVALVVLYALFAMTVAVTQLGQSSAVVHLAFFFISGLLWVLPAMAIVSWMARAGRTEG